MLLTTRQSLEESLAGIEWPTLFFFLGLFVMVGALEETGAIGEVADAIADRSPTATAPRSCWGSPGSRRSAPGGRQHPVHRDDDPRRRAAPGRQRTAMTPTGGRSRSAPASAATPRSSPPPRTSPPRGWPPARAADRLRRVPQGRHARHADLDAARHRATSPSATSDETPAPHSLSQIVAMRPRDCSASDTVEHAVRCMIDSELPALPVADDGAPRASSASASSWRRCSPATSVSLGYAGFVSKTPSTTPSSDARPAATEPSEPPQHRARRGRHRTSPTSSSPRSSSTTAS